MEGRSHYSEHYHSKFLERFKGKLSTIDKSGHIGVAFSASKPIMKTLQTSADIYSSASYYPAASYTQDGTYFKTEFAAPSATHQKYYLPSTGDQDGMRRKLSMERSNMPRSTMQKAAVFSLRNQAIPLATHKSSTMARGELKQSGQLLRLGTMSDK